MLTLTGLARCFVRGTEGRSASPVGPRQHHTGTGAGTGTGISPRTSQPGDSGAGHKFRSAQIKPSTRQNVPEELGANGSRRFAPLALKYCSERTISQKKKKLLARWPDSLSGQYSLTRPVCCASAASIALSSSMYRNILFPES